MAHEPHIANDKKIERAAALLALASTAETAAGPCLLDEELAALVDGRGSAESLTRSRAHIAECPQCYDQWLLLVKSLGLGNSRGRIYWLRGHRKLSYIGSALALAASLAVYLNVVKMDEHTVSVTAPAPVVQSEQLALPAPQAEQVKKEQRDKSPRPASEPAAKPVPPPPAASRPAAPAAALSESIGAGAPAKGWDGQSSRKVMNSQELPEKEISRQQVNQKAKADVVADTTLQARSSNAPAAPAEEMKVSTTFAEESTGWRRQLLVACQAGRGDAEEWAAILVRGERLQASLPPLTTVTQKSRIAHLIALIKGIQGADAVARQCRLIEAELAQEGNNR